MPAPCALSLPSTSTHTSIPISAEALETLVSILVWVKRPVTRSGRISSVTPFPLELEIFAENDVKGVPGEVKLPPAPIAQDAPVPEALKFPLDWEKPTLQATKSTAAVEIVFFMGN